MRSISTYLGLTALLFLFLFLFSIPGDPTGKATAGFTVGATVADIAIDNTTAVQGGVPITGGQPIPFTMDVLYNGSGVFDIVVSKPGGFLNGYNWSINESGTLKTVTDEANNLRWQANLSQGTVTLHFFVLPPIITITTLSEGATAYTKQVSVGAVNHFTDVHASTTVNTAYHSYTMTEVGTNVTDPYNFTVVGSTASWYGFNLSTKSFIITAERDAAGEIIGGGGGGGGGGGAALFNPDWIPEETTGGNNFELSSEFIDIEIPAYVMTDAELDVTNLIDEDLILTFDSTVHYLEPAVAHLLIPSGETETAHLRVHPLSPGIWYARLIVRDEWGFQEVLFTLRVVETPETIIGVVSEESKTSSEPVEQSPTVLEPVIGKSAAVTILLISIVLVLAIAVLRFIVAPEIRRKD